jgi:hypothetical protein
MRLNKEVQDIAMADGSLYSLSMSMRPPLIILICLVTFLFSFPSNAYLSTLNNGDVVPEGKYRVLGELQYLGDPSGAGVTAGMDTGINDSSDLRVIAGVGGVNFHAGMFYKWIPYPDTENQPAIGVMAGGTWARYNGDDYPSFRIHPLVSKRFDTDYGLVTPYASLPFGITAGPKDNTFPTQLAVGAEWKPVDMKGFSFMAELGLSLNESSGYASAAVLYDLPE